MSAPKNFRQETRNKLTYGRDWSLNLLRDRSSSSSKAFMYKAIKDLLSLEPLWDILEPYRQTKNLNIIDDIKKMVLAGNLREISHELQQELQNDEFNGMFTQCSDRTRASVSLHFSCRDRLLREYFTSHLEDLGDWVIFRSVDGPDEVDKESYSLFQALYEQAGGSSNAESLDIAVVLHLLIIQLIFGADCERENEHALEDEFKIPEEDAEHAPGDIPQNGS